ncbi:hypothetical protein SEA_BOMBSHELL_90 [Mycobacterium phage Bombshell]|uniref:Uncharacterized protein n=2 Tax=Backyardiganvirus peaches TaxID=663557 RepID=A0A7G8LLV3_9CAUD|nr:hypothetical protein SEA_MAVERICK_89 [Mycobacterium phage Maverick]QNJ58225.1 hypothetical protein SEA_BOMBSHELL_90 [Mycobacterium phage Bombshell]WNN94498.1 hypothetical protein SEA_KORENI_89 [Mycobacterium phage Koreni]
MLSHTMSQRVESACDQSWSVTVVYAGSSKPDRHASDVRLDWKCCGRHKANGQALARRKHCPGTTHTITGLGLNPER